VQRFVPALPREEGALFDIGTSEVWLFSLPTRELAIYGARRTLTLRGANAITTVLMRGFRAPSTSYYKGCKALCYAQRKCVTRSQSGCHRISRSGWIG
jgi:hypothetical protein